MISVLSIKNNSITLLLSNFSIAQQDGSTFFPSKNLRVSPFEFDSLLKINRLYYVGIS